MGIPEPNYKRRTLSVFSKSGCCMHYEEFYRISGSRLWKVEEINDYSDPPSDPGYEVIETKKLIRGKWRTFVRRQRETTD
jgi:hypothetical protein